MSQADNRIDVLDHGFVRLVSYMQPVISKGPDAKAWTGDLEVIRNARASYNADWRTGEDGDLDHKLINYLMKNRHTSPFEAMVFTFEVKAPIFVFRQWHRHRTWAYNEISARYTELPEEFYVPTSDQITTQSKKNKQQRTTEQHPRAETHRAKIEQAGRHSFEEYKTMLEDGVPRELARTVLPLGTYSRMFGTVSLHNLFHFMGLRDHEHAQYETRVYAKAMMQLIRPLVPASVGAYLKKIHWEEETQKV